MPWIDGLLRTETITAAYELGSRARFAQLARGDRDGYAKLFMACLDTGGPFMILEQDVVPGPGQLTEMAECDSDWCCVPYSCGAGVIAPMLGCSKYSAELCRRVAEPFRTHVLMRYGAGKYPYWRTLNEVITTVLQRQKAECHVHYPAAVHLHEYAPGETS